MEKPVKQNILIVDDEVEFVSTLKKLFDSHNYHVTSADNKIDAQHSMRIIKPDLLIIGTITPRGNAFLFHNWLKRNQNYSNIPVIIIDTTPEKQLVKGWTKDEGLRLEADWYFCRPLNMDAIMPIINKLLDQTIHTIKVLVADDHAIAREGIRTLLNLQKDIVIIGEAVDGKDAINKVKKLIPDVVIMDIVMPFIDGLEATRRIKEECNQTKVLILSQYNDEDSRIASYQSGAIGFIPKNSASSQLLTEIRNVCRT